MKLSLENDNSPLDADLHKVLPGVHERLQANHAAIEAVDRKVTAKLDTIHDSVTTGLHGLRSVMVQHKEETDELVGLSLGRSLVQAGNNLMRSSPSNRANESFDSDDFSVKPTPPVINNINNSGGCSSPTEVAEDHKFFRMILKHPDLESVWNEWHGTGTFDNDMYGGVAGRDSRFGVKWRKEHINPTLHSRTSRLIQAIQFHANEESVSPQDIIIDWDPMFKEAKHSVHTLVKRLQQEGKIPKLGARGKCTSQQQQ